MSGFVNLNYDTDNLYSSKTVNTKVSNSSNGNSGNISKYMFLSKRISLSGSSQYVSLIGRSGWRVQYGNFYLGKSLQLNYLGKMEGMPGGSGKPPLNKF